MEVNLKVYTKKILLQGKLLYHSNLLNYVEIIGRVTTPRPVLTFGRAWNPSRPARLAWATAGPWSGPFFDTPITNGLAVDNI